jgi:hypothetical protein
VTNRGITAGQDCLLDLVGGPKCVLQPRNRRSRGMSKQTVKVGMKFHATIADGSVEFTVTKKLGSGAWLCKGDPKDEYACDKSFLSAEILRAVSWQGMFSDLHNDSEKWWASQKEGSIVHYSNGFSQYVRGRIVVENGEKKMVPTALVGQWLAHDLPRRLPNGEVHMGYQADKVAKGETFRPHASNMYEFKVTEGGRIDPRTLSPIDLSVPELDNSAQKQAALVQAVEAIHTLTQGRQDNPAETLKKAIEAAQKALTENESN